MNQCCGQVVPGLAGGWRRGVASHTAGGHGWGRRLDVGSGLHGRDAGARAEGQNRSPGRLGGDARSGRLIRASATTSRPGRSAPRRCRCSLRTPGRRLRTCRCSLRRWCARSTDRESGRTMGGVNESQPAGGERTQAAREGMDRELAGDASKWQLSVSRGRRTSSSPRTLWMGLTTLMHRRTGPPRCLPLRLWSRCDDAPGGRSRTMCFS